MKRPLLLLPLLALAAGLTSGCASPYWQNRRADAADVFTATIGVGLGTTARIGPLHAGLGGNFDLYGIEAGKVGELGNTSALVLDSGGQYAGDACLIAWGTSHIDLLGDGRARGKQVYSNRGSSEWIPFWDPPKPESQNPARWTQIEVAVGLLGGVRLGFNPGELFDFILGFFGEDIYGDDLARAEAAEPESHAESAEGAE